MKTINTDYFPSDGPSPGGRNDNILAPRFNRHAPYGHGENFGNRSGSCDLRGTSYASGHATGHGRGNDGSPDSTLPNGRSYLCKQ